tara:strand:+ start:97624 stop:97920 length:297 start_codon:yes stop_codon:yes gene_type:complete
MSEKGLFATICSFFNGLFSSDIASSASQVSSNKNNDGLTGVERYIRNQASTSSQLTGVEAYLRSQSATQIITGVEAYIRNLANAQTITGVEAYIRNQG